MPARRESPRVEYHKQPEAVGDIAEPNWEWRLFKSKIKLLRGRSGP